jgi:antitoxin component HigA of HigAB toxin-antitoxin module
MRDMKKLTYEHALLIQRHFDGDLSGPDLRVVERLLLDDESAKQFETSLRELRQLMVAAEDEMWSQADSPDPIDVARRAMEATNLVDASLEELTSLLERFHDGETMPEEALFVDALRETRADVSGYLDALGALRTSVVAGDQQALENVDFGGFWDRVEREIDQVDQEFVDQGDREVVVVEGDREPFVVTDHQMLLQRYLDDEVSTAERRLVDGWVQDGDQSVTGTLAAYGELHLATNAAVELAQEGVDLERILDGVDARLDGEVDTQGTNVVSFDEVQRRRFRWGSQGALLAAGICLALFSGLLFQQLFPNEVIIKEKTVVIVDSVEYAPGASVMVNSPIRAAGFEESGEGEEPTVIWLLDTEDDGLAGEDAEENLPDGAVRDESEGDGEEEQPI